MTKIEQTFQSLIDYSEFFHLTIDIKNVPNAFFPAFDTITKYWKTARHWTIKTTWDSSWKVHENKKVAQALLARGNLLTNYFKLCERCHSFQKVINSRVPYSDAGVWFAKIFIELIGIEVDTVLNPPKIYNGNIKKSLLDVDRQKSKMLRCRENPFKEYVLNKDDSLSFKAQGLHFLIDASIELQDKSDVFKKDYWYPYLKSYSAYIADLSSPKWGVGYVDSSDKYWVQGGRGRGGNGRVLQEHVAYYKKLVFETLTP